MAVDQDPEQQDGVDGPEDVLKAGAQLFHGQYRIEEYLNAGGFGVTYLALDSLNRKVVIKECFPNSMCCRRDGVVRVRSSSHEKEFQAVIRDFGREALRMAKLQHPNIVGVHQVFEDNGTAYMALDFVEGRDLMEIIETEPESLNPAEIKRILLSLLDAVAYIHKHDVLHRDISPDNILIDARGNPVLIDFGAAREVATRASRVLSALHVVKDGYSPQEFYISSATQTASSDIYSLAATFYHLISGKAPPNSQARLAALAADENDPYEPMPPWLEGYDRYFMGAIDQALAVFPKHRLQTAEEWIGQIDTLKRQAAIAEKTKKDEAISASIRQLTAETNKAMQAGDEEPKRQTKFRIAAGPGKNRAPGGGAGAPKAQPKPSQTGRRPVSAGEGPARAAQNTRGTAGPRPRRRSFLTRIISVPISFFAGSEQGEQRDKRGIEP